MRSILIHKCLFVHSFRHGCLPAACAALQSLCESFYPDDSVDVTSEPLEQEVSAGSSLQHTTNKNHQLEVQLGGTVTLQCPQGSLGCWSHLDPVNARLRGLGAGSSIPTGVFSLKDVVYQDAGTYKCVGQSTNNKKKLDVLHTLSVNVKGTNEPTETNTTNLCMLRVCQ